MSTPGGEAGAQGAVPVPDRIVVCGLGGLGQHCVAMLRGFGVSVTAVDRATPEDEEVSGYRGMLDRVVVGDCRDVRVLRRADTAGARAILIVTPDERVNIETAFAARRVDPEIRLVVRCARERLNDLLATQLGNFVAFEPTHLAAPAFALAATEDDVVGLFRLGGRILRVVERRLDDEDRGLVHRAAYHVDTRSRRIVSHHPSGGPASRLALEEDVPFHRFDPEAPVLPGDVVTTVELADLGDDAPRRGTNPEGASTPEPAVDGGPEGPGTDWLLRARDTIRYFFSPDYPYPIARVAVLVGAVAFALVVVGAALLVAGHPGVGPVDGLFGAVVLLMGGYPDRFHDFDGSAEVVPWWLRGYALGLTVAGTALVGVVYAMVTEKLLTMRLQFLSRRPSAPKDGHVVVVGLGRVGQRVAEILHELGIPALGVSQSGVGPDVLPWLPVVTGKVASRLDAVNLERALGLVASTADDMDNLETALLAHGRAPDARLVVRASDARFSQNVSSLLPYANVLCGTALSAEVFAAAAFGENVLSLFRLAEETVMVTDYAIEKGDTLAGRLVGDVAHGYGLVPLLFERGNAPSLGSEDAGEPGTRTFLPPDDLRLAEGDRLVVLATSSSLRRVEHGQHLPRRHRVEVEGTLTKDAALGGAAEISRRTGAAMAEARAFMDAGPGVFHRPLHRRQAVDLARSLKRHQVRARVVEVGSVDEPETDDPPEPHVGTEEPADPLRPADRSSA